MGYVYVCVWVCVRAQDFTILCNADDTMPKIKDRSMYRYRYRYRFRNTNDRAVTDAIAMSEIPNRIIREQRIWNSRFRFPILRMTQYNRIYNSPSIQLGCRCRCCYYYGSYADVDVDVERSARSRGGCGGECGVLQIG